MHQFGWLSERGRNFFNLLQIEGVPRKGGFPQKKGGSKHGGNYAVSVTLTMDIVQGTVHFHSRFTIHE